MSIRAKAGVRYIRYKLSKFFNKKNEAEVQKATQDAITEGVTEINKVIKTVETFTREVSTDIITAGFQIGPNLSTAIGEAYRANPRVVEQLVQETTDGYKELKQQFKTLESPNKQPHVSEIFRIYETLLRTAKIVAQTIEANEPECKAIVTPISTWLQASVKTVQTAIKKTPIGGKHE